MLLPFSRQISNGRFLGLLVATTSIIVVGNPGDVRSEVPGDSLQLPAEPSLIVDSVGGSQPLNQTQPNQTEPNPNSGFLNTERYSLDSGDLVAMNVFGVAEYNQEYRVLSDGTLNLPLVGTVPVRGLSLEQASTSIQAEYARYLRQPLISLTLVEFRPLRFAISGEINRPGSYKIDTQNNDVRRSEEGLVSVTEAIQLAGGITQTADIRQIQIRRQSLLPNSEPELLNVDLWQLVREGTLSEDAVLRDGDIITVPLSSSVTAGELTEIATASFSPGTITVYVAGEVDAPGPIQVSPNTPLNQALLAAGGFNRRSNRNQIDFLRLNPDGTISQRAINVDFSQGANDTNNPSLRNNDTIVVSRSGATAFSDTVAPFLGSFSGIFGLLNIVNNLIDD